MSDFKTQSNTVKLVTSALFARKQPFMIVNGGTPGMFYYTSITPNRVALYRPEIEDALSQVTIKNEGVLSDLYEAFPKLKEIVAVIDLVKFSAARNKLEKKTKDRFPEMIVLDGGNVVLRAEDIDMPIGSLISDLTVSYYKEIIDKYNSFSGNLVKKQFRATQISGDDKLTLEIVDIDCKDGHKGELGYPVKDGFSMVSAKEYVNKRDLDPLYTVGMLVNEAAKTARGILSYADDWLDASTIMPGILWFL